MAVRSFPYFKLNQGVSGIKNSIPRSWRNEGTPASPSIQRHQVPRLKQIKVDKN